LSWKKEMLGLKRKWGLAWNLQAYKRVGGMTRSADVGRGIIGVMDVTEAMVSEKSCQMDVQPSRE
jgi:hypothetical protein